MKNTGSPSMRASEYLQARTSRPPQVAQRSSAPPNVRLTAMGNDLCHTTNRSVGIMMGRACNGFASATVTANKSGESCYRLMPYLSIRISCQNLNEVNYNLGIADILVTAPLTSKTMKSTLAHCRHGITQSTPKDSRRRVICVMVEKEQANPAQCRIRVAECSHLHGGDRHLLADPRSAFPRECSPSMDEIIRDLKVGSHLKFHLSGGRKDVPSDAVERQGPSRV